MKPTVKKEIALNEKLVATLVELNADVLKLNQQIKAKQEQFSALASGACLNVGLDFTTEGIIFSDDFKTISVYDLPKPEGEESVTEDVKPSKVKKMKA